MSEEKAKTSQEAETEAYLAKIRKTIAESSALVMEAELRVAETDRFLAEQGLTREQLLNFKFSPEQKLAVNEELRRRGLPTIEDDMFPAEEPVSQESVGRPVTPNFEAGDVEVDVRDRHRKFGMMMKQFKI